MCIPVGQFVVGRMVTPVNEGHEPEASSRGYSTVAVAIAVKSAEEEGGGRMRRRRGALLSAQREVCSTR